MLLPEAIVRALRKRAPRALLRAQRALKARKFIKIYDKWRFFADQPVDLRRIKLFRRESFPDCGPLPWLDRPDAVERIAARQAHGEISDVEAEQCRFFSENGFLILEGFQDPEALDRAWDAVRRAVDSGRLPVKLDGMTEGSDYEDRIQDLHFRVPELKDVLWHRRALDVLELLLGTEVRPFQTLVFSAGSEQSEHSDSVHMTTYPEGYLAATWTAMEDVSPDSGPLIYYPGSHKLPYYLSNEVGISPAESLGDFFTAYHEKYEPFVRRLIRDEGLEPAVFTPRKGDMLIWHANLLHGGQPRVDRERSRKSVVCHYFARGAVCYHDLTASLAHPY